MDTNIWVSALIWGGKPAQIINAAEKERITILTSEELMQEISQVLTYPKIARVYEGKVTRVELMETVLKIVSIVKVTSKVKIIHEHPADNKVLECASAANADYIISGDKHLIKVGHYKKTKILTASEFLSLKD